MEKKDDRKKMTRKDFLRLSGSLVAGGAIAGVSGKLIHDMVRRPDKVFFAAEGDTYVIADDDGSVSPYRRTVSVNLPDEVEAFDSAGDRLVVAGGGMVSVYAPDGKITSSFAVASMVRDICIFGDELYILLPSQVNVHGLDGAYLRGWDACSDESDYCSLAVTPSGVFVTDVFAKNICKYTLDGALVKFIDSPNGFVVPSYSFAIAARDGVVYCSNPGRHLVESYSEDGKYLASFGQAGTALGHFSGCCNPVHLYVSAAGEIITSEKGIPRICCYSREGAFRSVLLNRRALGGGYDAYEARISPDGRIFVAGKRSLSVYSYDPALAQGGGSSACSVCGISGCPIRRGITA